MSGSSRWMAKDESSGAVYWVRTTAEVRAMSGATLIERLRYLRGMMAPDAGGLSFSLTSVRRMAIREKRQLEAEFARRAAEAREA